MSTAPRSLRPVLVDNFFYQRTDRDIRVQVVPHLGLMSLATFLERAGHAPAIVDPKVLFARGGYTEAGAVFFDAWTRELLDLRPDLVGFTAYGRSLPSVVRVASELKRRAPELPVVLGGPHATILGRPILEAFDCIDVVVRFEAEPTIVDLTERLAAGRRLDEVPGLIFRRGGELVETPPLSQLPEMDEIPPPALHLYPVDELGLDELSIEAGRGCPFACTFCSTANFFQRRYRLKSNEAMVAEMEILRERYGVRRFNLNHDLFGLKKSSLREFCELVHDRGLEWKCSMRPDTLDAELVQQLAEAGCGHVYFGVETGSPRLQVSIDKRLDLDATRRMVAQVVEAGMACTTSFILGFPEETVEDQDLTLDMLGDLLRLDPGRVRPQLHVLSPEPGSSLAASEARIAFDGLGPEADEVVDDALVREHPEIFSVFYHYLSETPRWRQVMAAAFVTHLVPELGHPLTLHLTDGFFDGRLSRLFRAVAPAPPESSLDYDAVISALRRGLEEVAAQLARAAGPGGSYLPDLVRFCRVLTLVDRGRGRGGDAVGGRFGIARFDHDVPGLAQAIDGRPSSPLPPDLLAPVERWCLVGRDDEDRPMVGTLDTKTALDLYRLGSRPPLAAGAGDRLAVRLVEI